MGSNPIEPTMLRSLEYRNADIPDFFVLARGVGAQSATWISATRIANKVCRDGALRTSRKWKKKKTESDCQSYMHLLGSCCCGWDNGAGDRLAVHGERLFAGAGDVDDVPCATPCALDMQLAEAGRQVRLDLQAVECGLHAEQMLGDVHEGPCRGAGEPAVLALARVGASGPATIWQYTYGSVR